MLDDPQQFLRATLEARLIMTQIARSVFIKVVLDCARSSMPSSTSLATSQTTDDGRKDGDNAIDNCHYDGAYSTDNGHDGGT